MIDNDLMLDSLWEMCYVETLKTLGLSEEEANNICDHKSINILSDPFEEARIDYSIYLENGSSII